MFREQNALDTHCSGLCFERIVADLEIFAARPKPSWQHCPEARTGRLLREYPEWGTNFVWDCAGLGTIVGGRERREIRSMVQDEKGGKCDTST